MYPDSKLERGLGKIIQSTPSEATSVRDVVFISKATPEDDEFALWLGPRLEEAGYTVFTDILTLQPGDRWRRVLTATLQDRAIKMLLCARDATLAKEGVQEEIGIGLDLAKSLGDPRFVIPLRIEPYRKLFGIGEIQYVNFTKGWAEGLAKLLETLRRQKVPRSNQPVRINPNWEHYRRRKAVSLLPETERLTSNWLRITSMPETIQYFEPSGAVDRLVVAHACRRSRFPAEPVHNGFLSFGSSEKINEEFAPFGRFGVKLQSKLTDFMQDGLQSCGLGHQDASNLVTSMFRQAWNNFCRARGLRECSYANAIGFHAADPIVKVGERISWGKQGDKRSSMLRNIAKGHLWEYGVSGFPAFWPYPHFKLKSRVLFSAPPGSTSGEPYQEGKKQHRLRRTVCKGWRNKQWHGRLMAFVELLSGDLSFIALPLGDDIVVRLDATPMLFLSPVTTQLPSVTDYEDEETDSSTLGNQEPEDDT